MSVPNASNWGEFHQVRDITPHTQGQTEQNVKTMAHETISTTQRISRTQTLEISPQLSKTQTRNKHAPPEHDASTAVVAPGTVRRGEKDKTRRGNNAHREFDTVARKHVEDLKSVRNKPFSRADRTRRHHHNNICLVGGVAIRHESASEKKAGEDFS